MKFTRTEPDINFPGYRAVSENNVWEIGIVPVMYGFRVRAGMLGTGCVELDYCGGADKVFVLQLLATVVTIFESLPETVTPQEVKELFPAWQTRPIDKDPCWEKLQGMAAKVREEKELTPPCAR